MAYDGTAEVRELEEMLREEQAEHAATREEFRKYREATGVGIEELERRLAAEKARVLELREELKEFRRDVINSSDFSRGIR